MLEVITKQQPGLISFNYDEIKSKLEVELKKYDVVVTEETIKDGKTLKASLNNVKKQVEDERKRIKKEYCLPLVEFENQVKDLVAMLDAGYKKIDDQIKAFDESKKEARRKEIEEEYSTFEISKIVSLEKIFNPKWLNASCSKKACTEELLDKISRIKNDMAMIKCFMPQDKGDAKQVQMFYLETLDIGRTKAKSDELIALRNQAVEEEVKQAPQQEIVAPTTEKDDFKRAFENEVAKKLEETFDKPKMKKVKATLIGSFEFFDEMNKLVKKYNAQCHVDSKEVI